MHICSAKPRKQIQNENKLEQDKCGGESAVKEGNKYWEKKKMYEEE